MLDSLFLSTADIVLLTADTDADEVVPMPMERLSNQLSKILKSGEGVLVVMT
jgi:hypothetical protein